MNMQITKNKNSYTDNSLKKRIVRLEKALQHLLQMSINGSQADPLAKVENNKQNDLISDLISSATSNNAAINATQPTYFPVKNSINNSGSGKNNLALSRGQIIAELALAITRAGRRNS
jgi:uncharacterized FlgJ-related protein